MYLEFTYLRKMARRLFRLFLLTSCVYFAICVLLLLKHSRQQWVPLRGQLVSSPREDYFNVTAGDDEPAVAPSRNVKPQPLRNSIGNFRSTKLAVASSKQNGVLLPRQNTSGSSRSKAIPLPKHKQVAATNVFVKNRIHYSSNNSIQRLLPEKRTSKNKIDALNVVKNNLDYKELIAKSTHARNQITKSVLKTHKPVLGETKPASKNAPVIAKAVPHKTNAVPVKANDVSAIPKVISEKLNAVPVIGKAVPDKANAVPDKANVVPVIAKAVPDKANAVPDKANTVPVIAKAVPDKANAVPDKANAVPVIAKAVPDKAKNVPDKANAVPEVAKAVPDKANAEPDKAKAAEDKAKAVPDKTNDVPDKAKIVPNTQPPKVPIAVRQVHINNHLNGSSLNKSKNGNDMKLKAKVLPIKLASKVKANQREMHIQLNNKTITVTNNPKKSATNSSNKFLVYYCPQTAQCSGWGDQQRAIVDVFLLACIAKRHFRIILQSPCDVRNFYVPNKYKWIADEREFQGRTRRNIRKSALTGKLKTMADFNAVFPEDVIYVSTNGGHFTEIMANPNFKASMPTWAETFLAHHFHNAWDILMKPSARLQQRLEAFLHSVGFYNRTHPLVGVHVRVGKNPSNPNEVLHINDVNKTGPLWEFLDHYVRNGSHIFLASDSAEVRNISRSRFGTAHHDTDGVILHVSKQHHDPRACQGYEDALLDQLILTKCDVLVKSKSGFSLRAGYIRGRADNLFFYRQGKITKVTS
ncbi:uncharacterized protein [Littorina saxatilis]|uniref:uncharacterized protein n=1 Tax=Littorina saxatilis TaxID=31220 RepID=UPI0038B4E0FE